MHDERTDLIFVANRRFDPSRGEEWTRYIAWSGLTQLTELVTLDTMLCPVVPDELTAADWEHNVHEDYRVFWFRSLEYLRARIAGTDGLNLLAVQGNPTRATLRRTPDGFDFAGFDVLDVHADVSALVNLGGAHDVFAASELSPLGLLDDLDRAREVRDTLRLRRPGESHSECDVWAIWRGRGEG